MKMTMNTFKSVKSRVKNAMMRLEMSVMGIDRGLINR